MEVEIEEYGDEVFRSVYLNPQDRCVSCEQQYGCPLIECLANGLVDATSGINVLDCAHYRLFER